MRVGAVTDIGKVRQINEDNYYIPQDISAHIPLFVVADGMGGHNAGEFASKEAIDVVTGYLYQNYDNCNKDRNNIIQMIKESILCANQAIYQKSQSDPNLQGMGTTLVVVLIYNGKLYIGHVGDSRVYAIRRNNIYQLTRDHSYVEQLVNNGTITREQALNHPQKNIITRALGTEENVEIDLSVRKFFKKDTIILCTDGLTNLVTDEEIKQKAVKFNSCQYLAEELVNTANDNGGNDNITIVVIRD